MKKLFMLFLAIVICLTLIACGGGQEVNNSDPQTIENTGSNEIEDVANNEIENTVASDENIQLNHSSQFLPYICGEWKVLYIKDEEFLESVNISEDGNIEIDGSNFQWDVQSEFQDGATFNIIDGEEAIGSFNLNIKNNGDINLTLKLVSANTSLTLYKPAHYEIVSVNTENVYEYFEWQDVWEEKRNAFDELEYVIVKSYLVLKEPYSSRVSKQLMYDSREENVIENGAIELQYIRSGLDVVVNLEEKTYTFENFKSGTEDTELDVKAFGTHPDYVGVYARRLELHPNDEGRHTYTWACPYEMEITRLKLDLYLIVE